MTDDIATIRSALKLDEAFPGGNVGPLDALDRVAARLAQAELLLKGARRERDIQANAWKAQVEQAERERDEARDMHYASVDRWDALLIAGQEAKEAAEARARELTDALVATGCVGDHYCPGNPNFLGDAFSEDGEYDAAKWPLCTVCAVLAANAKEPA